MVRRARKCAIPDWFTVHTWLANDSLLPISDTFTIKAFYICNLFLNIQRKKQKKRMETRWKATSEKLILPLIMHKYLDERAENSTMNLKLYD